MLSAVKLIAEPWDIGPGGYQVGGFPPGWAEWNDKFRDTVRAFWKGDEGKLAEMATRLAASADCFARRGRKPWSSVNFITAHDGFTLNDLVSYNEKHNEANGEDNQRRPFGQPVLEPRRRGADRRSRDHRAARTAEAQPAGDAAAGAGHADAAGRRRVRPHAAGQQQRLCQDNEISWVDWDIGEDGAALAEFVRRVIALRQAFPILRRSRFLTGEYNADLDVKDVRWLTPAATDIEAEQWHDANARCFGMLMDGRAQATGIKRPSMDATVLLVLNAYHDVVKFTLPEVVGGQTWRCLLDTNVPDRTETPRFLSGDEYEVTGRSLLLFALQPDSAHSVVLTARTRRCARWPRRPCSRCWRRSQSSDVGSAEAAGSTAEDPDPDAPVPIEEPPPPIPVPRDPPPEPLRAGSARTERSRCTEGVHRNGAATEAFGHVCEPRGLA